MSIYAACVSVKCCLPPRTESVLSAAPIVIFHPSGVASHALITNFPWACCPAKLGPERLAEELIEVC
jgi:hypothetical protein